MEPITIFKNIVSIVGSISSLLKLKEKNDSHDHASIYYDSLEIAKQYLELVKNNPHYDIVSIIRSACQHLETAFTSGFLTEESIEKNDLILSIIRLHFIMKDEYSIILFWAKKLSRKYSPNEELTQYLTSSDFGVLKSKHNEYIKEEEEIWKNKKESDEEIRDFINNYIANYMGFP